MYIEVQITAYSHNDADCNILTFTDTQRFSIARPPTPDKIREMLQSHKDAFLTMWPHRGLAKPTIIPLEVEIIERDSGEES